MYQASTEVADGMDIPGSRVVGVPMGAPLAVQKPLSWRSPDDHLVPVTGLLTDSSGEEWHRVEYRRQGAQASGHRSCEPVVMFPPPHTLCPVGPDGRFLDLFEQKYGRLDPVFERLSPRNGRASGHRRRPALAP